MEYLQRFLGATIKSKEWWVKIKANESISLKQV